MRIVLFILLGFAGLIGLIVAIVMFVSSGARDQAKDFLADISIGAYDSAYARLHRSVQDEIDAEGLAAMFAGNEPYADVSFSSVNVENSRSELSGTATTASGCVSEVTFVLLGDLIAGFNVTPLCPQP